MPKLPRSSSRVWCSLWRLVHGRVISGVPIRREWETCWRTRFYLYQGTKFNFSEEARPLTDAACVWGAAERRSPTVIPSTVHKRQHPVTRYRRNTLHPPRDELCDAKRRVTVKRCWLISGDDGTRYSTLRIMRFWEMGFGSGVGCMGRNEDHGWTQGGR